MPASSSPICSGEPVWTVWRREVNGSQFNLVARLTDARAGTGFCRNINPGETIETIGDISRKTLRLYRPSPTKPNRSGRNAEAVFPPFHHSARRHLHPGLAVQPERNASRSTRFRAKLRAPAGSRLQQQESIGGLRDLLRQRDQRSLTQFFVSSQVPPTTRTGCPPPGRSVFGGPQRGRLEGRRSRGSSFEARGARHRAALRADPLARAAATTAKPSRREDGENLTNT